MNILKENSAEAACRIEMNAAFCPEIARSKKAHCRLQKPHVVRSAEEIFRLSRPAGLIKQFVERPLPIFKRF